MAETKDKVVTVESLSVLHEHNKGTYMPMVNPVGSGTMTIDGDGSFSGNLNVSSITISSNVKLIPNEDGIEIVFLNQNTTTEETSEEEIVEES